MSDELKKLKRIDDSDVGKPYFYVCTSPLDLNLDHISSSEKYKLTEHVEITDEAIQRNKDMLVECGLLKKVYIQ